MSKLIPMDEAANMLGMTVEQLSELRSNHEIFGYRDGQNWKFKLAELERVAGELDIKLNTADAQADYSEDSSVELVQSGESLLSVASDDAVNLDGDDEALSLRDSGLLDKGTSKNLDKLAAQGDGGGSDILASDKDVLDDDGLSFGSSSLSLASESGRQTADAEGTGSDILDEELQKTGSASDTGEIGGGDDDLLLSADDDLFTDELELSDSASFEDSVELSSDFEDSDLILDDSDSSSEIMLEANASGINLSANESGISLGDEPLELGGSDIDALELPEDDDDMIVLDDATDPEAATMMQEDDFNLTPLEASMEEDESSGSQVIALEDSEIYADESSATILGESDSFPAQPAMLDDPMGLDSGNAMSPYDDQSMPGGMIMAQGGVPMGPAALPEAPYTVYQVISLGLVAMLLITGGMVAYNLAQNMWMPEDQVIGSSVLNFFLKLTGMNNN
ncbi:MAG: helix-turn-helix domain-containing protein [Mariniblastus sp.]|nr:helix-turn-helix domain-containing protein [Mariniblastus sp.]